jgi:hypothetical protein
MTAAQRNSGIGLFRQCNGNANPTVAKRAAIAVPSHPTVGYPICKAAVSMLKYPFQEDASSSTCDGDNDEFVKSHLDRQRQMEYSLELMSLASNNNNKNDGVIVRHQRHSNRSNIDRSEELVLRRLTPLELQTLEGPTCRCTCNDWSKVQLLVRREQQFVNQSSLLQGLLSDNRFEGIVVFVVEDERSTTTTPPPLPPDTEWHKLPIGIHSNLLISNSILHVTSCRVYRNAIVSNTHVSSDTVLINCGLVNTSSSTQSLRSGGNDLVIVVGAESGGGRTLSLTAEDTMIDVCHQLRTSDKVRQRQKNFTKTTTTTTTTMALNILSSGCVVRDTPTLQDIHLSSGSSIHAATSVCQAVLLPGATVGNGCTASSVLLQWNASILDHSTVSQTLLMEQAHCGPHSLVASSVLGPDVHVSAGEVHASVLGPNTNAHHQSLLIGVLWPMGRGNVGYGANVGSNHTGRVPDQETAAGEGTFWGLSTVIKFPVDLTCAPYSIVAAGVNLPPQRVCMPFSLIMEGGNGGNEIVPGWVLQSSPYTLARSETKFATRRTAQRHDFYTGWKIFRPETIELCRTARASLMVVKEGSNNTGSKDNTPSIGANVLTKHGLQVGIRAYTQYLRRYALQGLLHWIVHTTKKPDCGVRLLVDPNIFLSEFWGSMDRTMRLPPADHEMASQVVDWPVFPWETSNQYWGTTEWEYQRLLLLDECQFPIRGDSATMFSWLVERLQELVTLEKDHASRVFKCKKRDDIRGAQTIPGYADSHVLAENDPVIVQAQKEAAQTQAAVEEIVKDLGLSTRRSKL